MVNRARQLALTLLESGASAAQAVAQLRRWRFDDPDDAIRWAQRHRGDTPSYTFIVTVTATTKAEAERILAEHLGDADSQVVTWTDAP